MSKNNYEQIMSELPKRQEHLSKYAPFFSILESMKVGKYKEYSASTIMISLMSFMLYEGKLKEKELFFSDIQEFLSKFMFKHYGLRFTEEESIEFTRDILDKLGNKGLKFSYRYLNPVKNSEYTENVQYMSAVPDRKTGSHKYYLTNVGIEFLLNTKEFGDESKISIYLLLLQKQLKNDNLEEVLNKLVSINAEIKKQIEEKQELMELLIYAPSDKFEEYLEYKDKAIATLSDEEEMFAYTRQQVLTYEKNYLENMSKSEKLKVQEAPITLEKIKRELERNIINHASLMSSVLELSKEIPKIRADRMRRMFKSSFNFENQANEIFKKDDLELLKYLIDPLLSPKRIKGLNINKIGDMFSYRSKVSNDEKKEVNEEEVVGDIYTVQDEVTDRLNCNYYFYMRELLGLLVVNKNIDLGLFINHLSTNYGDFTIENRDFISFVHSLVPHAKDRKKFKYKVLRDEEELSRVYRVFVDIIKSSENLEPLEDSEMVCIPSKEDYVELDDILKIRNMTIEVR